MLLFLVINISHILISFRISELPQPNVFFGSYFVVLSASLMLQKSIADKISREVYIDEGKENMIFHMSDLEAFENT